MELTQKEEFKQVKAFELTEPTLPMLKKSQTDDSPHIHQKKPHHIYKIYEAQPPTNFEGLFTELPTGVEFKRILLNAISFLKAEKIANNPGKKSRYDKWLDFLQRAENIMLVSDAFWYCHCKFFFVECYKELSKPKDDIKQQQINPDDLLTEQQYEDICQNLKNRMARNYVNYFLDIDDKYEKEEFFKRYFDILAQSVFYAFFYAFPKSRVKFNDDLKKKLVNEFSKLLSKITISNTRTFTDKWCLDLGAGNLFKMGFGAKQKQKQVLPAINKSKFKASKRNTITMRYSPLMKQYLTNYKYKTINYLKGFKMKFTPYDENQYELEQKFDQYKEQAEIVSEQAKLLKKLNDEQKSQLNEEIKKMKKETVKHQRRLEKRKIEELEKGAHEYANYLVSMLNSGITVATLGIGIQKNA